MTLLAQEQKKMDKMEINEITSRKDHLFPAFREKAEKIKREWSFARLKEQKEREMRLIFFLTKKVYMHLPLC